MPMVHRCKKRSDISKVTSGGRAEIENVKNDRPSDFQFQFCPPMSLLKCHSIFTYMDCWEKNAFVRLLKYGLLEVLFFPHT